MQQPPAVGRIIGPVVRDDVNRHRALFAQLDELDPLSDPTAAPAAFPDHQYLRAEQVVLQISNQPGEVVAGLAGVA